MSTTGHAPDHNYRIDAAARSHLQPDVTVLTRISDPVMQHLLEEVWQPYWARLSDADLARALSGPPGLELARWRRAKKELG